MSESRLEFVHRLNVGSPITYPTRVFASVLPYDSGYVGLVREFDTRHSGNKTHLRQLMWNRDFVFQSDLDVCLGEDPRICKFGNRYLAMYVTPNDSENWTDFNIYIRANGNDIPLHLPRCEYYGKNWVPVDVDGRLLVIRSIEPLCILEVDPDTGICTTWYGSTSRNIGEHRGGGNAILSQKDAGAGKIIGFGHRTHSDKHHTVFRYEIDLNPPVHEWKVMAEHVKTPPELDGCGIVDPTSHWIDANGDEFIAVCATPGNWNNYQLVTHAILKWVPATETSNG